MFQENYHKYDGFIILHGTDTLAYTASALSFMLDGLQKPVIVTGAQVIITILLIVIVLIYDSTLCFLILISLSLRKIFQQV